MAPKAGRDQEAERERLEKLIAEDARKLRELLALVVKLAGLTQRDVEERLGLGSGYVSNVLKGRVELKHSHVAGILAAAHAHPADVMAVQYPRDEPFGHVEAGDFTRRLERLGGLPKTKPPEPDPEALPKTREELWRFVVAVLEAAGAPPPKGKRKRPPRPPAGKPRPRRRAK
jgi:transcriptional regulator with XRE-family HTH domain